MVYKFRGFKKSFGWKQIYINNPKLMLNIKCFWYCKEAFTKLKLAKNCKIKDILTRLYDYMKTHFKHERRVYNK